MISWAKGTGKTLPEYALRTLIMRTMNWDYWTYCNQPQFVIDQVIMFLSSEGEGHRQADRRKNT